MVLLSFLIGGGSGDLLDYVPTQSYWSDRGVSVTADKMLQEAGPAAPQNIAGLIADLGAADPRVRDEAAQKIVHLGPVVLPQLRDAAEGADPEVAERSAVIIKLLRPRITVAAVRRLMALRALGELKDAKALPFLRSQLDSGEMFVADYARIAIGSIEGDRVDRAIPKDELTDVWLLPSNCRAVGQLRPRGTGPIDADRAAAQLAVRPEQNRAQLVANLSRTALNVAEQLGDMRLDTLSVGLSDNIDANHGGLTLILSGQFDSANAGRALREHKAAEHAVDGVDIFEPDRETTVFFPSDHKCVVMFTPLGEPTSLAEVIGAMKSREQPLKKAPEMAALVAPMLPAGGAAAHAVWIAVKVSDAYRQLPGLDGFDTVTLVGDEKGGALHLTARAESTDAQTAAAALQQLNRFVVEGAAILKTAQSAQPSFQPAIDFLGTIQLGNKDKVVTGTGTFTESPAALFMLPLTVGMMFRDE